MNTNGLASALAVIAPTTTTARAKARLDVKAFQHAMRKLWQDHLTWTRFVTIAVHEEVLDPVTWTRLVIIGVFEEMPELDPTVQRLLQNREDIGDAIKPFYGDAAGEQLSRRFRDHILIAAQILQAAKSGDMSAQNDAVERWYANADDIALFLHAANSTHWPFKEIRGRMREHLDLTLNQAFVYSGGDYDDSIAAYDAVHLQSLEIADMLSEGIIRQFPDEFGRRGSN